MADVLLKPGSLLPPLEETWHGWDGSMAAMMEEELNALLALDTQPLLSDDVTDRAVRDRRRLFVAIARGVARHLHAQRGAFEVRFTQLPDQPTATPEIGLEGV